MKSFKRLVYGVIGIIIVIVLFSLMPGGISFGNVAIEGGSFLVMLVGATLVFGVVAYGIMNTRSSNIEDTTSTSVATVDHTPMSQELGAASKQVFWGRSLDWEGLIVERWADIFWGEAEKYEEYQEQFKAAIAEHGIKTKRDPKRSLSTGGFFGIERELYLYSRPAAAVAVTIATQGNDIYISWRLFVRSVVNWGRVILWLGVCAISTLLFIVLYLGDYGSFLALFLFVVVVTGILLLFTGYFFNRFYEFFYDDAEGLAIVVQKSISEAADQLGIDTTKMLPREAVMRRPRRRRI